MPRQLNVRLSLARGSLSFCLLAFVWSANFLAGSHLSGAEVPSAPAASSAVFYHPDAPPPRTFPSLAEYLTWYRTRPEGRRFDPTAPTVGHYSLRSRFDAGDTALLDESVRSIERQGGNAVTLLARGSPPWGAALRIEGRASVDVLLFGGDRLNLADYEAGLAEARLLGVPILGVHVHYKLTPDEFAASPHGLHPFLSPFVTLAERDGMIEPLVVGAKGAQRDGRTLIAPLPAQIDWRVSRALGWARLHRRPNSEKRVVFTYWSQGGGKANLGGSPISFLDVQASLVRILSELKAAGYDTGPDPLPDVATLTRRMALEASNVGTWAPGELARRVQNAEVALVPEAVYRTWFDALPTARRTEMTALWGPPPGELMVHTAADGKRFLVIPKLQFGNVVVAPHPDWGYLQSSAALHSAEALPTNHYYLAFFLWLQREFKADAWVSLFTNLDHQIGKAEGPAADDPIGLLLGALPHIHPARLGTNGSIDYKRKALAQTVSWFNPVVPADADEPLHELRARLARYDAQTEPDLRRESEPLIRAEITRTGLDRALAPLDVAVAPFGEVLAALQRLLADLDRARAPAGSKVLGDAPSGPVLADMVVGMLGDDLRRPLAPLLPAGTSVSKTGRALVAAVLLDGRPPANATLVHLGRAAPAVETALARALDYANRLRAAPREIASLLEALSGRWIEPGPMDEPVRQPDSVPPGRSVYNFDSNAVPTAEAESLGIRQADALIAAHREKHAGAWPTQVAVVLWSTEIARTHGINEAKVLHLLGTRAVRDTRGKVTGVALIPREELGRPRVDVLASTSGHYRDHYLDKIELISEATRLAAASPEADNPIAKAAQASAEKLRSQGESPERARALSLARVFSPAPGAYSPSIQFLARSGDQRGDEAQMANLYTRRMSFAYGQGFYGESARPAFEQNLARLDAASFARSTNVNGLLDGPMPAGFLGGLNLAAKAVTGRDIDLYVANQRDAADISVEPAARAIQRELRARYFNPKWLRETIAHGYDGARKLMYLTDHLDLWNSTARQTVTSADWAEVKATYVDDRFGLRLDAFFEKNNPYAHQLLLGNLVAAATRGHWQATATDFAQVSRRLAQSAAAHGLACDAHLCRNPALTAALESALGSAPDAAELMQAYRGALEKIQSIPAARAPAPSPVAASASEPTAAATPIASAAPTAAPSAPPMVEGKVLEDKFPKPDPATVAADSATALPWLWLGLGTAAIALFAFGLTRRAG
jgi:cobaltochelatase CobN